MMNKYKVAKLLTNPYRPDPRVQKESQSLCSAGHEIFLICWDRLLEFPRYEDNENFHIIRIGIKSKYSAGSRQVPFLLLFLIYAINELWKIKPDIVHCHDLDTAAAGAIYSRIKHIPWIFDAHECYPEQIGPQVSKLIYKLLCWFERFIVVNSSVVITVGNILADHFRSYGVEPIIVGNYPKIELFANLNKVDFRRELDISNNTIIISYIGGFTKARSILPLIEGADLYKQVIIMVAGDGPQRKLIEEAAKDHINVKYIGWIPQELVPRYTVQSDIIYYGLVSSDGNSRYSTPNTLFNAMAAGKPLLTTDIGEIAYIVKEENCGVVIPEASSEYISRGIHQLEDYEYRQHLGNNGRNAAIKKYNWDCAEDILLQVYSDLLPGNYE